MWHRIQSNILCSLFNIPNQIHSAHIYTHFTTYQIIIVMKRLWIFRGKGEFFLGVLAISIPSYYAYTIYIESKFNNTIVDQSISLLSKNPEIRQILGSPLHYKSSTGSQQVRDENYAYYSFRVGGPKGNLPVQVSAAAMELSEVYHPSFLQTKYKQVDQMSGQLATLNQQPNTKQTKSKISELSDSLAALNNQISEKLSTLYNRFYIVQDKNMDNLIQKRKQQGEVPADWKVWSITNLHMNLPNGSKVIVIPNQKTSVFKNQQTSRWTYDKLYNKLHELPENLTDEQIQQYNKQKSMNIYSKYNTHRLVTFLFLGVAAMGALWYKSKYTLSTIQNTSLTYTVKSKFSSNKQVSKLGRYIATNNVEGGRRGSIVDAKIKVEGPKKSYIHVLAKYNDDGSYKPEKIQFIIESEKGEIQKRINLQ